MKTDDSSLTLLKTCGDPVEASTLRSLLDANGIYCVVRGENHNSMLGLLGGGAIIELGVLVAQRDLERARALLASEVVSPGSPAPGLATPGGVDTEAVCPVHGERSTALCSRCGTFLCARCGPQVSGPPLCEDCSGRNTPLTAPTRSRRQRVARVVFALALVSTVLLTLLALFWR